MDINLNKSYYNRRDVLCGLGLGLGATALATTPLGRMARAQSSVALPFQLSWIKSIQYGGYFAGLDNGFYAEEGIDAEFNSGGPGIDAIANVATGESVLGDRPSSALIVAADKGLPITVIATVFQKSPGSIMSLADNPITSVAELEGKTVALPNTARPIVALMLNEAGVDPDSVSIVPVGTDPGILASGQVDAYYGYATNQGLMLQTRGVDIHVLNMADAGAPNMAGTIYARNDFLEEQPEAVIAWLRASSRAWRWALDHPAETADLMVDTYGAPGLDREQQLAEIEASAAYMTWGPAAEKGILALDPDYLQQQIDMMRATGIVETDLTAASMTDTQYVDAALADL